MRLTIIGHNTHMANDSGRILPVAAFVALALIWGASFLLIKVGVSAMSPATLVLVRTLSGALALVLVLTLFRPSAWRQLRKHLGASLVMALVGTVLPFVAISWGEIYIASGLASILNATIPLWTGLLALWVAPAERPTGLNFVGIAIGLGGVAILVGPQLLSHGLSWGPLGALAVVGAAFSYAAAALFQRRHLASMDPIAASLAQLLLATLLVLPLAVPGLPSARLSGLPLLCVLALGIGGTGLAYVLYYYLLNSMGAARATTVTYLIPVTAVAWGALLLGEPIGPPILAGMAVVLLGVLLATRRRRPVPIPAPVPAGVQGDRT